MVKEKNHTLASVQCFCDVDWNMKMSNESQKKMNREDVWRFVPLRGDPTLAASELLPPLVMSRFRLNNRPPWFRFHRYHCTAATRLEPTPFN